MLETSILRILQNCHWISPGANRFLKEVPHRKNLPGKVTGQKNQKRVTPKRPLPSGDHMDEVKGQSMARFLSDDLTIVKETKSDEVEKAVETLDAPATGLVVDRTVDQKLLDRLVWKGLEYVAAKDFKGIIKRPLSIRLLKMSS